MRDDTETPPSECDSIGIGQLCERLAGINEVHVPSKQSDENKTSTSSEEHVDDTEKSASLKNYFIENPLNFLRRYHEHIKPKEISCFNDIGGSVETGYYIRKICQQEDLACRTEMNSRYLSHEIKNRRYRALQKMIKDGEYFSEIEMKKRCPYLYEYYIGRFLTTKEKEEKLKEEALAHPTTLSGFFMDVIEKKNECEEDQCEEEFDEEEEEEDPQSSVPVLERSYLADEFRSRMYQRFLEGMDKHFEYETVDSNSAYDDVTQMERDAQDDYFDNEEPCSETVCDEEQKTSNSDSEDELDIYMRQLGDETCNKIES